MVTLLNEQSSPEEHTKLRTSPESYLKSFVISLPYLLSPGIPTWIFPYILIFLQFDIPRELLNRER